MALSPAGCRLRSRARASALHRAHRVSGAGCPVAGPRRLRDGALEGQELDLPLSWEETLVAVEAHTRAASAQRTWPFLKKYGHLVLVTIGTSHCLA